MYVGRHCQPQTTSSRPHFSSFTRFVQRRWPGFYLINLGSSGGERKWPTRSVFKSPSTALTQMHIFIINVRIKVKWNDSSVCCIHLLIPWEIVHSLDIRYMRILCSWTEFSLRVISVEDNWNQAFKRTSPPSNSCLQKSVWKYYCFIKNHYYWQKKKKPNGKHAPEKLIILLFLPIWKGSQWNEGAVSLGRHLGGTSEW